MAKRDGDIWLEDFSFVLAGGDYFHSTRGHPQFEIFAESKALAVLWLAAVATVGGAYGGTLVSAALWASWLQPPIWLAAIVVTAIAAYRTSLAVSGQSLAFLAGWCLWWGIVIGAVAMWAAQLSSAGWAYGVAVGVGFFLVGIVQGVYEPDDLESHDGWFMVSALLAPVGASAAAWIHRNMLAPPTTLETSALAGAIAALIFLGPAMAFFFAKLDNVAGLKQLASLLLHRDEFVAEAVPLLDTAIRRAPDDASLFDRRGLAHALRGNLEAAQADWTRHLAMKPKSNAPDVARGWVALRGGRPEEAAAYFTRAAAISKRDRWALAGLGVARMRQSDPQGAIEALKRISGRSQYALGMTYLAEAHMALGEARAAEEDASVAIDEMDSIHGRSWMVRAAARRALGDIDGAAKDYNTALTATDEPGIEDRAMAGLEEINRPVRDEDYDDEEYDD